MWCITFDNKINKINQTLNSISKLISFQSDKIILCFTVRFQLFKNNSLTLSYYNTCPQILNTYKFICSKSNIINKFN